MTTTLLIARHAETDWNLERRWQGHADPPLNETGRKQARALAARLDGRPIEAVYSSDLQRARETAEIVAERLGLPVRLDVELREVDVGEWSGLTVEEVEARYPEGVARRREGGNGWVEGETYAAMGARISAALHVIAGAHPGDMVFVVTHGGPVRMVRRAIGLHEGDWRRIDNCEVDTIAVRDGRMRWLDSSRGGLHEQVQG